MLPELFINRMKDTLGEEFSAFLASYDLPEVRALRINPLKGDRIPFEGLEPVPWSPHGFYYEEGLEPGKHPYHEAGAYYIQEPSAQAVVSLLAPKPGERVLDLCAAPGGKSSQAAGELLGEGILIANEINPQRARILSENMERMGVANVVVTNETPVNLSDRLPLYFDCIIVDAPCSGEGMFRKNDLACEEWSPENVALCANRQDMILDCANKMLRPGGRLVYSTCTFAVEEDEGSVERFLGRYPGQYRVVEQKRLWPHKQRGEGHFIALLQKEGDSPAMDPVGGYQTGVDISSLGEYPDFVLETLAENHFLYEESSAFSIKGGKNSTKVASKSSGGKKGTSVPCDGTKGGYLLFGDNLYRFPAGTPNLRGLKVLRPGLQLGEFKKNRFEPSHALALALKPEEAKHCACVDLKEAAAYLNGMTLNAEGEKGWYVVSVDGYTLGWGKLAGSVLKNHYPKGLRK